MFSKILFRDAENFFRHQCELVLRHQMQVSNYFVKFFYSVPFSILSISISSLLKLYALLTICLFPSASTAVSALCSPYYMCFVVLSAPYVLAFTFS